MEKINTILACVDLSEYSSMTLKYAVKLAKGINAHIIVLSIINQRDIDSIAMASGYFPSSFTGEVTTQNYIDELRTQRNEKVQNMIDENFPGDKFIMSIKIDMGIPFEQILKAIDTEDADLVVMANKGRGNLSRVLFGSAAEKVFRHSPVPVVSVRDHKNFDRKK